MSNLSGIIKSIQKIMREDHGVDGDAQRLSQLVWMLFLKIFDETEEEKEVLNPKYKSPVPEELRWRNWAEDDEGMTGDDLLEFINNKLFPTFKNFEFTMQDNEAGFIVKSVFEDSFNYMKSGTLIRQVINKINDIDFNRKADRDQFGLIYEELLRGLQSAGNDGEFYTPRALTEFIIEMVNPRLGEKVYDPACGTGGFLTSVIERIRKNDVHTAEDEALIKQTVKGNELKQLPHMLCVTNMMLHGISSPTNIVRGDSLAQPIKDIGPDQRVDCIVANPPFGGTVGNGVLANFPTTFRTKESADLFLVLFLKLLKPGGRAGIVLPDGSLAGEGIKGRIHEKLLEECELHTVIRLPNSVFAPYATAATNLLFFTKGKPTKEVWYYEHKLPKGQKSYSKTKPIQVKEFEPIKDWWNNRAESDYAWKVSIELIKKRNYDLDIKNPNKAEFEMQYTDKDLIQRIKESHSSSNKILDSLKGTSSTNNFIEVRIGDFLKRIKRPVDLENESEYKLVTISLHHKGVKLRCTKKGRDIKSKMYEVKEGDFILSGIDARNGAFGIVPSEIDGAIVTNDFWYFELDKSLIDKYFFLALTSTKWFDEICRLGSDGTTQRIRLQKDRFFNQKIFIPSISEQKKFSLKFKAIDELKRNINRNQEDANRLMQILLHKVVKS